MLRSNSGLRTNLSNLLNMARTPLSSLGQGIRGSRLFQPSAIHFHAKVRPAHHDLDPALRPLAERLSGDALIRFSSGLWREEHDQLPDLLSCAIRFKAWQPMEEPTPDTQDLMLTSARSPWTLAIDAFRTDQHDFLANPYHAVWPYQTDGHARLELRLMPQAGYVEGDGRFDRLRHAAKHHEPQLLLEVRDASQGGDWQALLEIRLTREVEVDQARLSFSPFRDGQGLRPVGFMQYLRPLPGMFQRFIGERAAKARDQAQEAAGRISSQAQATAEQARDQAEKAQDSVRRGASRAAETARSTGQMAREMGAMAVEEATRSASGKSGRSSAKSSRTQSARKGTEAHRTH